MVSPPSTRAVPATLCPPPRTESGSPVSRANWTAATTSAVPVGRTTSAGVLSIIPFHGRVAAANPSSLGRSTGPRRRARSPSTIVSDTWSATVVMAGPQGRIIGASAACRTRSASSHSPLQ